MPQMGGQELADRVKMEHPDMRILFMSGYVDDEMIQNKMFDEEIAFLQKPFSRSDLAKKVREVLDS